MTNKSNSKEKIMTIEAELPIPLGELAVYLLKRGRDGSRLLDILYNKPEIGNIKVKKIIKEIICKKKFKIQIKELNFDYNDSDNLSHGVSYFKVKLKGTENELKKVAGEDKICFFDWENHKESIDSA